MPISEHFRPVFAQGMRRSGTTVLFDLMLEDGQFTCFYEPLAAAKEAKGGGSGIHAETDLFVPVRQAREDFLVANPQWLDHCPEFRELNLLNYGAPRLPELEFEPDIPPYVEQYIEQMATTAPCTFIKFTRLHSKIPSLKRIAPQAKLIHIVRDPRSVVCSYLFGKNGRNRAKFPTADVFFKRTSTRSAWSSYPFSEFILSLPGYEAASDPEDFLRVLAIWKYKFERTHAAGQKWFGDDYLLFRHEDLTSDPIGQLRRLGTFLGVSLRESTFEWVRSNLRKPAAPFAAEDKRWLDAFSRLGMEETLRTAGYGHILNEL